MPELQRQRILRIGVIRGGKIIEEKLVRRRIPVSVGTATRNSIVLPSTSAPKSFSLFEVKANDYYLAFTDEMTGRISVGEKAADLQSLKAQNLVRRVGNINYLKLSDASRGRVSVGECIILFQFVNAPPEPVRPQLPATVRGYWMRNIDWPYTSCLGGVMLFLLVLIVWAKHTPIPEKKDNFRSSGKIVESSALILIIMCKCSGDRLNRFISAKCIFSPLLILLYEVQRLEYFDEKIKAYPSQKRHARSQRNSQLHWCVYCKRSNL